MLLRPTRLRPVVSSALVVTLAAALSACTSIAFDRDAGAPTRLPGSDESVVTLAGSYTYRADDVADRETLDVKLEAGQQVAPEHELGAWLLGRYSNLESDPDPRRDLWAGVHYRYHWYLSDVTSLSLGPTVGYANFDLGDRGGDAFAWGAMLGARHWVSSTAALTMTPMVLWTDHSVPDGASEPEWLVHFGVAFRL